MPLIVVDSPSLYDPTHDMVLMVTVPRKRDDDNVVLLNGTATPPAREMRIGEHAVSGPSEIQMGNGETYDFEFVAAAAGALRIDVTTGGGVVLASLPIHVR